MPQTTGSPVPYKSLCQARATFMPDAAWAVCRFPPDLSRVNDTPSVLTSSIRFRHFISGSLTLAFLTSPDAIVRAFSVTLTTPALYRRSLRWFEASSYKAASEDLPPSLVQHCFGLFLPTWQSPPIAFWAHYHPRSARIGHLDNIPSSIGRTHGADRY